MSLDKPVWLLDVDGVLNALQPGWPEPAEQGLALAPGGAEYLIQWAPSLVKRIKELCASNTVDIHWCTTWCDAAGEIERLLGLPPLVRELIPGNRRWLGVRDAKVQAAIRIMHDQRRPLIWTDDDMIPAEDILVGKKLRRCEVPYLLIAPDPGIGLLPVHMELIELFVDAKLTSKIDLTEASDDEVEVGLHAARVQIANEW